AGDVPEEPTIAEPADLRSADHERFVEIGTEHGAAPLLHERDAIIVAGRAADGDVEWHGHAACPASVVRPNHVAVPDHGHRVCPELVEGAATAECHHWMRRNRDDIEQIVPSKIDVAAEA